MNPADATMDRELLTERAYPDSTNLRARASIYDYRQPPGDLLSWVLDHAEWPDGVCGLDVGCGPGAYLARTGGVGVDLSLGMAREARRHAPTLVADVCALPIGAAAVDRLLAPHMLYHVANLDLAASELRRVLRPGGVALVVTNHRTHLLHLIEQLSVVMGIDAVERFVDRFHLDNGAAVLERHFADVRIDHWRGELVVPDADPVLRYADSCRSLYELQLPSEMTWDDSMVAMRAMVEREVEETGAWRCETHSGVFVCQ